MRFKQKKKKRTNFPFDKPFSYFFLPARKIFVQPNYHRRINFFAYFLYVPCFFFFVLLELPSLLQRPPSTSEWHSLISDSINLIFFSWVRSIVIWFRGKWNTAGFYFGSTTSRYRYVPSVLGACYFFFFCPGVKLHYFIHFICWEIANERSIGVVTY